jgi:hypothetical protein
MIVRCARRFSAMETSAFASVVATAQDVLPEVLDSLGLRDANQLRLACREARDLVRDHPWNDRYTRIPGDLG